MALTGIRIGPGDLTVTTTMMGTATDITTDTAMGTRDLMGITTAMMGTAMDTGGLMGITTAGTAGNEETLYSAGLCLNQRA
jgi:hypothetical protein